jgi:hypothetical protein
MLDRRRVNRPAAEAELAEIAVKLSRLDGEREELRLKTATLFTAQGKGFDPDREGHLRKSHDEIAALDSERQELRSRRRELLDSIKPAAAAVEALHQVEMPRELKKVMEDLDEARQERVTLIRDVQTKEGDNTARKLRSQLDKIEENIRVLRIRRADLLAPHNAAVRAALTPVVRAAAQKLASAAVAMREALIELSEISLMMPPTAPGIPSGLERAAVINQLPTHEAESFAAILLQDEQP